ncbi:hypothetical protein [Azospirillum largimobile]
MEVGELMRLATMARFGWANRGPVWVRRSCVSGRGAVAMWM